VLNDPWVFRRHPDAPSRHAIPDIPVHFTGLGFDFILLSGSSAIRKVLNSSHYFDWNKVSAPLFAGMFGGPKRVSDALLADDSGVGAKPYPGSNVHPGRRLLRNQVVFFSDAFSRASLDELVPRFVQNLEDWCKESNIASDWVEMPDLFTFVRDVLFVCGVDSFFGKNMLSLSPGLKQDFWEYDGHIPSLATPTPGWMKPAAVKSRDKCLAAVKLWRKQAINDSPNISDDSNWDPAWGLGAIRRRNKLFDATDGLFDDEARAATDLALLWA
jgi:hypothetical protein